MKKTYITLEEVLALRGTDTKIYNESSKEFYYKYNGDILCIYREDGTLDEVGVSIGSYDKHYILEQEEFKVEKVGLYKTRDGRVAYVSVVSSVASCGIIEGDVNPKGWGLDGRWISTSIEDGNDLVEYIGD